MINSKIKPPTLFWIIAVLALLWNIMGVIAYLSQAYITEEALALLPEPDQLYINNVASLVTAAYATAVFTGMLGSIALLIRKKIATLLFTISFIGVLIQSYYNFFIQEYMQIESYQIIMSLVIILICVFLIWYSKVSNKRAWIS